MKDVSKLTYSGYLFTAIFVALISALMYFTLGHIKKLSLHQVGDSLTAVLSTVQDSHHLWIDQRRNDAREYASRPNIVALTQQLVDKHNQGDAIVGSPELETMRVALRGYLAKNGDPGFFLITPDYISIGSMRDVNIDTVNLIHLQRRHLLDQSFQGETVFIPTIVSDVALNNNSKQQVSVPTMFIVTPIRTQGEIIAVLSIRIDPSKHFTRIAQLGRIGNTGETYAFDEKGLLITNSRFDQALRQAGLIKSDQNSILNIKIVDPGENLLLNLRDDKAEQLLPFTMMAESAIAGRRGLNTSGYRDYRGVMVVGAWLWETNYGFGLAVEIDLEEALIPYYNMRNTLVAVVSMVCLLGFILSALIQRMDKTTAKKLKEARDGLEVRVTERTLELEVAQRLLSKANAELNELAITDGLTGMFNRRHFDDHFQNEWRRCVRDHKQLAIILFDVDYFKAYNDFYGHQLGDECLKKIANHLLKMAIFGRPGDIVARYGGEEFVICISDTSKEYAEKVAEIVRQEISNLQITHLKSQVASAKYITVSVGIAIEEASRKSSPEELLFKADKALYAAKHSGRNTVCTFDKAKHQNAEVIPLNNKVKA